METVGDFMEDWIKKWKQELSWQERWDVNGWKPKPKMVIDLDNIYKDGKLFGCDVIQNDPLAAKAYGMSLYRLDYHSKERNKIYRMDYWFDWERCAFTLSYRKWGPNAKPYEARTQVDFHMLFDVKLGMEQMVFEHAAESVIREVEKLIDNDKKDNRNS